MSGADRLDQEEARWAEALRGLPQPGPSEALDRRVLAAAREAVAPRRPRARRWHWGGAAAAALVLLAVAPQLWRPGGQLAPSLEEAPFAPQETMSDAAGARETAGEALESEPLGRARSEAPSMQAAPPPPAALAPAASPPAAPPAAQKIAPERRQQAPTELAEDVAIDRVTVTGSRLKSTEADERADAAEPARAAKPAPAGSARLDPQTVELRLDRIRRLRADGDDDAAARALRELLKLQPGLEVPEDLRDLLPETPP
ncbi:hypothetical protein [Pseudomarimonas salicorniae]|uniref:Uncharacterized protein n=1 Tax=Pseudomarimonas salicorniae TaxID=2933270 RepID=A0ABT0GFE4_9GAMM|nr:hypothetical protein [Lysobacter sp. CAU 1642]MCK7593158.1 hypothetical protein [Lysobacter sp. CAU 1642]